MLVRWMVAALVIAMAAPAARAEMGPALTALEQAELAFARLAGTGPEAVSAAREVSTDILFLLEEVERLGETASEEVKLACGVAGDARLTLRDLSGDACLRAALVAERAVWRLAAEVAAQSYLAGREELAIRLPMPGLDSMEADEREVADAWWNRSAPAALDAFARIGREWIKRAQSEVSEETHALAITALNRTLREPSVVHLRQALGAATDPALVALNAEFQRMAATDGDEEDRLNAAARFSGALDELISGAVRELLAKPEADVCAVLLPALVEVNADAAQYCAPALAIIGQAVKSEEIAEEAVQAVALALSERTLTIRLLLAKAAAAGEAADCPAAINAMATVAEPLDVALDLAQLEAGSKGVSRVLETCLPAAGATLVGELCSAGTDLTSAAANAAIGQLPEGVWARLEAPWKQVLATGAQPVASLCADPAGALAGLAGRTQAQQSAFDAALTAFGSAALDSVLALTLDGARPYLDQIRFPARMAGDALSEVEALCTLADGAGTAGADGDLSSQLFAASLRELGLIDDAGQREQGFADACRVVTQTRGQVTSDDLPDVIRTGLQAAAGGEPIAAETLTAQVDTVLTFVEALAARVAERGPTIARRAATAVVLARAGAMLNGNLSLDPDVLNCGDRSSGAMGEYGLDLALQVEDVTAHLDAGAGAWTVNFSIPYAIAACGPVGNDARSAQSITTLVSVDGEAMPAFNLDEATDPAAVLAVLRQSMRDSFRNAEVDMSGLKVAAEGKVEALLRAAGLEPAWVLALTRGAADIGIEWDAQAGLLLRPQLPGAGPDAAALCLQLRLNSASDLADGCIDARNLDELPARLSAHFVQAAMPRIVTLAAAIGITLTPEDEGRLSASLSGRYLGAVYRDRKTTMVLRIPVEPINAWLDQLGADGDAAPFIGDFVLPFEFDEGGQLQAGTPTMPAFNPDFLLEQFEFATANGFVHLTPVAALPANDGRGEDRRACEKAVIYRADMGPSAPLQGLLGHMCLDPAGDGKLRFVAAKNGELVTRDLSWRFSFRRTETNEDIKQNGIDLALSVQSRDPAFASVNGLAALVQFDLENGDWRLPNDAPENQEIYAAIETAANGLLPAGVRIFGVGFGSDGLALKFDVDEAAAAVAFADLTAGTVNWENVRSQVDTACDVVGLHTLARMIETGKVQATDLPCPDASALDGETEVLGGASIFWECAAADAEELANCRISFDRDATLCQRPLTIEASWDRQHRDRTIKSPELERCFTDRLESILPEDLSGALAFKQINLVGSCLAAPESCELSLAADIHLRGLFDADADPAAIISRYLGDEAGNVCGDLSDGLAFKVTAGMTFNGATRFGLPGAEEGLMQRMDACAQAMRQAAINSAMDAAGLDGRLDDLLEGIAEQGVSFLQETTRQIDGRLGSSSTCSLVIGNDVGQSCENLDAALLRAGGLSGVEIGTTLDMLDVPFRLATRFTFDPSDLDATRLLEGADPQQFWQDLRQGADASFSLDCGGQGGQGCLDTVTRSLLENFEGRYVKIGGQASLIQASESFTLSVPLILDFGMGGIKPTVVVGCTVSVAAWDQIGTTCDTDVSSVLLATLAEELTRLGPQEFDLDLFTLTINPPKLNPALKEIEVPVILNLAGLDIGADTEVEGTIIIDHRGAVSFDTNIFAGFVDRLEGALTDAVNDLVGDILPVKVTDIEVLASDSNGVPTQIGIQSEATLYEVMSISAPMLVLGRDGIKLDGPGRYSITIVDGLQIPIPPVALCPNGGAIEDSKLTLTANITIGECTASHILSLRGAITIDFDNIDSVSARGDLVLLSVIPLGHTEGSVEIDPLSMTYKAELGGAIADIISMSTDFNMTGNPMIVDASGDGQIFRTPVATMQFHLDLDQGLLDSNVMVDLLFAKGDGSLRTERGLSRPTAELNAEMTIGGLPAFGSQIRARPSFAKVAFSIFGLRLAIAFPGLDAISSGAIKDLIENLLTPDFENLDEALMALLNGNLTINPFAGFGSGGDGMGDSGDGGEGESGEGNGAGDPGEGLGGDAPATAAGANQPDPGPVPPGGEPGGGLLGSKTAELWFQLVPNSTLLRIGTGALGTDQEEILALAQRDAAHFDDASGVRRGETLSILDNGYSQILVGQQSAGEPCAAPADASIAVFYTGAETPRRGFYELCRLQDVAGQAMSPQRLKSLSQQERQDLAFFHEALLEELRARPELPGHDHGRLLLKARMVDSKAADGLRGVIGFQRPGEVLAAITGRIAGGQCHATPGGDLPAEPQTRLFWLMGLTAEQLDQPDELLEVIRHLWNCEPGTMARIDVERETVTTASAISARSEAGYQQVAQLPEASPPAGGGGGGAPPWARDVTETADAEAQQGEANKQEKAEAEALRETVAEGAPSVGDSLPSLCSGEWCAPMAIQITQGEGRCVLTVDGSPISNFDRGQRFGEACNPIAGLTWLTRYDDRMSAIVGLAPSSAGAPLSIAVFTGAGFGETPSLALGIASDTITRAEIELLNSYLDTVFTQDGLSATRSILANQGTGAALTGPAADGSQYWAVRRESAVFGFSQTGGVIGGDRLAGVLPLITAEPEWFELLDADNFILAAGDEGRVYRWVDGQWALTTRLHWPELTIYENMPQLRQAALDAVQVGDTRVADVVVIPHDSELKGWGVAQALEGSVDGSITMRPVQLGDIVPNQDALRSLTEGMVHDVPGGSIVEDWFVLEIPVGAAGLQVATARNTGSFDPVLCVYGADGMLVVGDDDKGPADLQTVDMANGPSGRNARVILPDHLAGSKVFVRVTPFNGGEGVTGAGYSLIVSRQDPDDLGEMNSGQCNDLLIAAPDFSLPENAPVSIEGLAALVARPSGDSPDDYGMALKLLRVLGARILSGSLPEGTAIVAGRSGMAVALRDRDTIGLWKPATSGLDLSLISKIGGNPPSHALAGIVDHLAAFAVVPELVTGAPLPLDGVNAKIDQAWAVDLPDIAGGEARRAIYYLFDGQPQSLLVPGAAADGPVLAQVLDYATANEANEIEILRATDASAIALATFDCSTGTCTEKLVHFTPGQPELAVAVDRAGASEGQIKVLVDAFSEAVTAGAALSDATTFQGAWPGTPDGIGAFRLTKTGPLQLVQTSGAWLCLNVDTPSVTDPRLHALLQSWPANFEHWRDEAAACPTTGASAWTLELVPSFAPADAAPGSIRGLLHGSDSEGRLTIATVGLGSKSASATTEHPVPAVLAEGLVEHFSNTLARATEADFADFRVIYQGSDSKALLIYNAASSSDAINELSEWTIGLMPPQAEGAAPRECVVPKLSVSWPRGAEGVVDEIVAELDDLVDQTTCGRLNSKRLVVVPDGEQWTIFTTEEVAKSVAPIPERIRVATDDPLVIAQAVAGLQNPKPGYLVVEQVELQGRSIKVPLQTLSGLDMLTREHRLRTILEAIVRISDRIGGTAPDLQLDCIDNRCDRLWGKWGVDATVGVELFADGGDEQARVVATYPGGAVAPGPDIALSLLTLMAERPDVRAGTFEVALRESAMIAVDLEGLAVSIRTGVEGAWKPLGNFPVAWSPSSTDRAVTKLRAAALQYLLGRAESFKAVTLDQEWAALPEALRDSPAPALLAFGKGELREVVAIRPTGESGPTYVTDETFQTVAIARHAAAWTDRAVVIWLPGNDLAAILAGLPLDGRVSVLRVAGIATTEAWAETLLSFGERACTGLPAVLAHVIAGALTNGAGSATLQLQCDESDAEVRIASNPRSSRAYAADQSRGLVITLDPSAPVPQAVLLGLAKALLADGGATAASTAQAFTAEGKALITGNEGTVLSVADDLASATLLGRFSALSDSTKLRVLLSRMLARKLSGLTGRMVELEQGQALLVGETRLFADRQGGGLLDIESANGRIELTPGVKALIAAMQASSMSEQLAAVLAPDAAMLFERVADGRLGGRVHLGTASKDGGTLRNLGALHTSLLTQQAVHLADTVLRLARAARPPDTLIQLTSGRDYVSCLGGAELSLDLWTDGDSDTMTFSADRPACSDLGQVAEWLGAARAQMPAGKRLVFEEGGAWLLHSFAKADMTAGGALHRLDAAGIHQLCEDLPPLTMRRDAVVGRLLDKGQCSLTASHTAENGELDGLLVGWGGEAIFFAPDKDERQVAIDDDAVDISTQRRMQLAAWLALRSDCDDAVRVYALPEKPDYHAIQGTCAGIMSWHESSGSFRRIVRPDGVVGAEAVAAEEGLIWSVLEHFGGELNTSPAFGWVGEQGQVLALRAGTKMAFILKGGQLVVRLDAERGIDQSHFALLAKRLGGAGESGFVLARAAVLPADQAGRQAIILATRGESARPTLVVSVGNPEDERWATARATIGVEGWVPIRISGTWDMVVSPAVSTESPEAVALRSWLTWQLPDKDEGALWFEAGRARFIMAVESGVGFRLLANRPPCRIPTAVATDVLEQFLAPGASDVSLLDLVTKASRLAEPLWYLPSLMADPRLKLEAEADCLA